MTYDIDTGNRVGERRLTRVAKACERFGVRVQDSVFECRLNPTRVQRLIVTLSSLVDPSVDSVHVYRFEGSIEKARQSIGRAAVSHHPGDPWIL